jgi:mevalonate kinase
MDAQYINKVKQWVELDNKIIRTQEVTKPHIEAIEQNKETIKPMLDKKKEIEDEIVQYIESNKLEKLTVNITDGAIKFGKKTSQQPITLKLLKSILDKYSEEEDCDVDTAKLYDFILDNLDKKTSYFMKRDIK